MLVLAAHDRPDNHDEDRNQHVSNDGDGHVDGREVTVGTELLQAWDRVRNDSSCDKLIQNLGDGGLEAEIIGRDVISVS